MPHWPPYRPDILNKALPELVKGRTGSAVTQKVVVSDQPWAVAWYADEISLWLPKTKKGFEKLEDIGSSLGTPFAGFLITPSSADAGYIGTVRSQFGEFNSMIFNGIMAEVTAPNPQRAGISILQSDPKMADIVRRYSDAKFLSAGDLVFYGQPRANQ